MQIIPIKDTPAQTVNVTLNGQNCQLNIYVKSTGTYCDVYVNTVQIIAGVACQNLNRIVRDTYLGFIGDLFFNDTQGLSDPTYPGFGTRYQFMYALPGEY